VLFALDMEHIATANAALANVGLTESSEPTTVVLGQLKSYRWTKKEGNPLNVGSHTATPVDVILAPGEKATVIVNLGPE
jgi:hypothetical protein